MTGHQAGLVAFLALLLVIALTNMLALPRLGRHARRPSVEAWPMLSILVPARNEAAHIGPCVRSLLAQEYPHFEVIALDDDSQDATGQILTDLAASDARLTVLQGSPLPDGWLGKHWACHQLGEAAHGDLLLFTDADTRHHPLAARDAVAALTAGNLDLLTALPFQEMPTFGEALVVPILYGSIFSFLPLALLRFLPGSAFSAAIGQFMLFRRGAYERLGGYAAVSQHAADDLALVRLARRRGLHWQMVDGGDRVHCRMYTGFRPAFLGVSKSLFAAFGYRVLPFMFVWVWLAVIGLEPPLVLAAAALTPWGSPANTILAAGALLLLVLIWALIAWRFRFPWWVAPLSPVILAISTGIAFHSLSQTLSGKTAWKGRRLAPPKIHWL